MILHRYSTKDGSYVWTRGKTDALRDARKHAKVTPKNITLEVEAVELAPLTTKTLILALLNGEDVVSYNEEGDVKGTHVASIKGRCRAQEAPEPLPKPQPTNGTNDTKTTIYDDPHDAEDQEYAMVYQKKGGWRLVKLADLRPGMKVALSTDSPKAAGTIPGW